MGYQPTHARALALVQRKGATVTLTRTARTYTATTDTLTSTTSTVTGSAIRVPGNPNTYQALKLVEADPVTLLFAPSTYDTGPALGDTVTWDSKVLTVRDVQPIAPNGEILLSRMVVA